MSFFMAYSLILTAFEYLSNDNISWFGILFQALFFGLIMAFTFTRYNKVKTED
ncbi:hypothetical protein JM84_1292 [Dokdonia sp. Hel_I_63]|nr:hypothetical protein Krodi_0384 [Dokdonia sp. 4H-3-7-5]TVZ22397.1 hypothetical protein JM84_1292 [Dokdonia sp. Hel_I_63]